MGHRSLPAQLGPHQCDRRRQTARAAMARHRRRDQALRRRDRHLGMGEQRPRRRARCRDGLRRRRSDDGDPRGGRPSAPPRSRPQDPGRQCRRSEDIAAARGASHGIPDHDFDALFTTDKPVIFAHHGYPWLIHRLTYRRTNHRDIHVRGYKEEGTTTPFDMVVRNDLDRFHLAADVIDRVPKLGYMAAYAKQALRDKLIEYNQYITRHGDDMPEVKDWRWPAARA